MGKTRRALRKKINEIASGKGQGCSWQFQEKDVSKEKLKVKKIQMKKASGKVQGRSWQFQEKDVSKEKLKVKKIQTKKKNDECEFKVMKKLSKKDEWEFKVMNKLRKSEKHDLSVGFKSVLRSLRKEILGLVVLSKDIDSVLIQTAKMCCLHNNVALLSVDGDQLKILIPNISRISVIGVKRDLIDADKEFKSLVNEIQEARVRKRSTEELEEIKKINVAYSKFKKLQVTEIVTPKHTEHVDTVNQQFDADSYPYHKKQSTENIDVPNLRSFIPLSKTTLFCHDGFPNYDMSHHLSKVLVKVMDKEGLADLSKLMET